MKLLDLLCEHLCFLSSNMRGGRRVRDLCASLFLNHHFVETLLNNFTCIFPCNFFWDPKMCTVTWYIYVTVHWIAWWRLLGVETCRYMRNWRQINSCVWLKLYILINGEISLWLTYGSEIIPTRCNNCVYSSQWLHSTCFGRQFHPSSGVHMLYMAFQVGRYTYVVILSIFW